MEHVLIIRRARSRSALQRQKTLALHRAIRDVTNPFLEPNFKAMYRLTPDMALSLISEIRDLFPKTGYGSTIPVEVRFLAALHFYSQGSYQKPSGRDACVSLSKSSISRCIQQTTEALNHARVLRKWINFPVELSEMKPIIEKNYRRFKLQVLGLVDGTHIVIKRPVVHEEHYVNRKGQHSINVQMVCDCDLKILNVMAKYPGSSHDAFIWKASLVREKLLETHGCWLLGDSGYPLEPWLMTPILYAEVGSPEEKYTQMHIKARASIERCFGVLKGRFRCLIKNRVLKYNPTKTGEIVNACAVLHNFCVEARLALSVPEEDYESIDEEDNQINVPDERNTDLFRRGVQIRASIINRIN